MTTAGSRSLEGVRVLDLSRVLAGPFCAMLLADLGADVVKVETPWGDDSRTFGPFTGPEDAHSAYYRLFNRSKSGISLDLKCPEGVATFEALVERSDVVVENFRPGVLDRLGIGPDHLRTLNPRLIVTSISGFGQTGSRRDMPAYDLVAQAMSGVMSVTGWPGVGPTRVGVSLGDLVPGLYAALGTLGALEERHRTGRGQHVDVAMFDSLVSVLESVGMRTLHSEESPVAVGNDHALSVPYSTYAAADGDVVIAVSNDRLYARLAQALELEHTLRDPRFATYRARSAHREEMRQVLEEAMAHMTVDEATARLEAHGVPSCRVATVEEALTSPYAQERSVVVEESDGFRTLASPLRLTGSVPPTPAPELGEHNHLIDRWLREPPRTG